jgi:hypothetical protein
MKTYINMMAKVKAVLAPFLAFASTYIVVKAHNMFALMLDPWFKSLNILKSFAAKAKVIHMVQNMTPEFDAITNGCFQFLNFNVNGIIEPTTSANGIT